MIEINEMSLSVADNDVIDADISLANSFTIAFFML